MAEKMMAEPADTVLSLRDIRAGYDGAPVLQGIRLDVPKGAVVALLGANGAGKTTLLRTASGLLKPQTGSVMLAGKDVTRTPPHRRARAGLCHITEGRAIFPALSVRDNLELAIPPWVKDKDYSRALGVFPALGTRLKQVAGSMSGGEQQMLSLARAFLCQPKVVLADEVSMGLAPMVVDQIFDSLHQLTQMGISMLLVEQYVQRALEMADFVYLLQRGEMAFAGPVADVDRSTVVRAYVGTADPLNQMPSAVDP
jgi:branched-chain amino acid transport system ATP-binding protein